ncbi:MAG: GTPase ObgE [Alphaproteobacteria bacterium]|nr:MAG: GTPase ObgE [Alphaproteobacteria bacterium]
MKFLDEAKIYLESGKGGPGCVSFRREKCEQYGGPNGGDGGRGGDVVVEVIEDTNTLIDFRYQQHFRAGAGENGKGSDRSGAKGDHCVIKVPVGTVILGEDKETELFDCVTAGEKFVVLKGGDGGKGNAHYKSSTNQAPRKSTPGYPGDETSMWLRLKLIADVGLLGLPNAGKSTFLSVVSNAKPKIADYPFTTLHPNLGVVQVDQAREFVIADIPGLIEGASDGHGLGTRFLGHVERCSALLHLVDCTIDDPVESYRTIRNELKKYKTELHDRTEIVALTKIDSLGDELAEDVRQSFEKETGIKTFLISSIAKQGVTELLRELTRIILDEKTKDDDVDYSFNPV